MKVGVELCFIFVISTTTRADLLFCASCFYTTRPRQFVVFLQYTSVFPSSQAVPVRGRTCKWEGTTLFASQYFPLNSSNIFLICWYFSTFMRSARHPCLMRKSIIACIIVSSSDNCSNVAE